MATRRRGRPYRLPSDPTPLQSHEVGLRQRIAWLLGVSRIHSTDPDLARRDRFLEQLRSRGVVVDTSRLSRWESGQMSVSRAVVTAYEEVLGLARRQLAVGIVALSPTSEDPFGSGRAPLQDSILAHEQLDGHFEDVLRGRAPGHLWLELSELITSDPHVYLMQETWSQLTELLATELGRSTGMAFLSRFQAQRMLVAHPGSRRAAVRAIGTVVTSPATEFVLHPLSLLEEVQDPQADDLLLRLLHEPPSHRRAGASWAVASKAASGHLAPPDLARAESATLEILERTRGLLARLDALNLYVHLPPAAQQRISRRLVDHESADHIDLARVHGLIEAPEAARAVASRIAESVQGRTHTDHLVELDPMLARLVCEMLFHARHARRHQAALLLAASPYRAELGASLSALAARPDEAVAVNALHALTQVADSDQRGELLRIAVRDPRASVRVAALMALGQVVGPLTADEERLLVGAMPDSGPLCSATMYVLGIGGATSLTSMSSDDGVRGQSARWWGRSGAITEPMARS
ncbi:hypothetical protein [Nocardioides psychrotolerans]|uniref:hypothetical protein n=1 Tax=Nocardioides psychrotolerans TaxID=1005945 RepID=UPI00313779B3